MRYPIEPFFAFSVEPQTGTEHHDDKHDNNDQNDNDQHCQHDDHEQDNHDRQVNMRSLARYYTSTSDPWVKKPLTTKLYTLSPDPSSSEARPWRCMGGYKAGL